jgi:DNA polymerase-3 subunit alpha
MQRGWTQEQVDKLWEDILAFAKYSFNKSHSQAYAITAYISMYIKVHYPVEFITAYVNSYDGDIKGVSKVLQEAIRMNIDFRFDNWRTIKPYTEKRENTVLLGINTLKGFGRNVSVALNEVGKNQYNNFKELIQDLLSNSNIDKSQILALIQLNIFNEFAENGKLEKLFNLYVKIYDRKQFDKKNLPVDENILRKYSKETDKQFRNVDSEGLFGELCTSIENKPISIKRQLNIIFEYQGFINYVNEKLKDYAYVTKIDTKYSPKVRLYYLNNGEYETCKISKKIFTQNIIETGNIIQIIETSRNNRSMWNEEIQDYVKIPDEYDTWINSYIKR